MTNLKINHLQHVGIPVTDIEISQSFYERLGFKRAMNATFMHEGEEGKVSMMKRDGMIIELYQMPEAELVNVQQRKDGKIDHIAFDVDDINEAFDILKKEGFSIIEEQPVFLNFWVKGCKYFYITGPDGERLEFCQIL
jgi:lactoylglutathione lyase